ncbi:MAG: hypothetical protein P0Y55_17445 [Candidatus Cohnella colombiensis]|uniref:Uncharacterized protein n=1 Tax=Candidatus Cohnella colombiensis TaxID=3121368 RepID=A0AA95EWS4_9BACL|nr:MAG: hypothetical protein P0Y55_17445 [Cohnella sp.]
MSEHNQKPEWYKQLKTDEQFPGSTFTSEKMGKIERRIAKQQGARQSGWRIWTVMGGVVVIASIAFWLLNGQFGSGNGQTNHAPAGIENLPIESQSPIPVPSSMPEPTQIQIEDYPVDPYGPPFFYVIGDIETIPTPDRYQTFSEFVAEPDEPYSIAGAKGAYTLIVTKDRLSGWIPSWYLSSELENHVRVEKVNNPYVMMVGEPVTYSRYPDEPEPHGFVLWRGKVVQVVKEFGDDWVAVREMTYDSPYVGDKWLRRSDLQTYDKEKAREGYVDDLVQLYDETGKATMKLSFLAPVYINDEVGDRYLITSTGGVSGYMNKADFIPNPFIYEVLPDNYIGD